MTKPRWTVDDIPDLRGKLAVVTGANSGLGLATARALARKGAKVVLACRSQDKAEQAIASLMADLERLDEDQLEFRSLDLADLDSVRSFAEGIANTHGKLDLLINNAGVMALPYRKTAQGFEMQLGTNHLGHFALTGRLLPLLLAAPAARVVTVSSHMHRVGKIRFDDLHFERGYRKLAAYGQSKLANLLFTYELQRRLERARARVIAVAAHPGYSATDLLQRGPRARFFSLGNRLMAQGAEQGALPSLHAATAPEVQGGEYYGPGGLMELKGHPIKVRSNRRSHDRAVAERLWSVSIELTGVDFDALGA